MKTCKNNKSGSLRTAQIFYYGDEGPSYIDHKALIQQHF